MIQVRDAVAEDATSIAGLLGELGCPASAAEIPARLRAVGEAPGRVLVAVDAGNVVGVASVTRLTLLHRRGPVALLSSLEVQTVRRGEGVGRALVEMAERQAAAWGCETLELTSRDDRHRTHRFYTGPGFESAAASSLDRWPAEGSPHAEPHTMRSHVTFKTPRFNPSAPRGAGEVA